MNNSILILGGLLFVKHFVADFLYQPPYQWQNKGTYGHLGGILHSGQHALLTWLILICFFSRHSWLPFLISIGEFVIHYHMDWFKMKYNKYKGWGATTHNEFWVLLGVDQLFHSLTYIGIMYAVANA
jgi:hypothetical protein